LAEAEELDRGHEDLKALRQDIEARASESPDEGETEADNQVDFSEPYIVFGMYEFNIESMKMFSDNNFRVEGARYGEDMWIIIFRKFTEEDPPQQYLYTPEFDENTFDEYGDENFYITKMASDGENWFFVMDHFEEIDQDQLWLYSPGEYPDDFENWENNGYQMDLFLEAEGNFFGTTRVIEDFTEISTGHSAEVPETQIQEAWDASRWIKKIYYVNEVYINAFGDNDTLTDQGITFGEDFPQQEVIEKLENGHFIQNVLYADNTWIVITAKKK
jgi:hypothetical protein